jgi:hypothetical protein
MMVVEYFSKFVNDSQMKEILFAQSKKLAFIVSVICSPCEEV